MKKIRRSMLFLPGANAAMLSTSFVYKPDSIMFDLEDAVSIKEKDSARLLVAQTLRLPIYKEQGIETVVRINALDTPFGLKDLEAVVRAGVDVVRLPMTNSAEDIHELDARCAVLHAARVAKIDAFDVVYSNVNDDEGFLKEVNLIKKLGYNGKSLINPRQIDLLHNAYAPTAAEVEHAQKVVEAAEEGERKGLGVISLNGKMIDAPIIARARKVIELAKYSGVRKEI